jgi:hypothetical protein
MKRSVVAGLVQMFVLAGCTVRTMTLSRLEGGAITIRGYTTTDGRNHPCACEAVLDGAGNIRFSGTRPTNEARNVLWGPPEDEYVSYLAAVSEVASLEQVERRVSGGAIAIIVVIVLFVSAAAVLSGLQKAQ